MKEIPILCQKFTRKKKTTHLCEQKVEGLAFPQNLKTDGQNAYTFIQTIGNNHIIEMYKNPTVDKRTLKTWKPSFTTFTMAILWQH